MSLEMFIRLLQSLITMADTPENVERANSILISLCQMGNSSRKVDRLTAYAMHIAASSFDYLVAHRKEFAGVPGQVAINKQKRHRLRMFLSPGC
ncbi:MAG: hypothetical protein Q4A54_01860 [Parabacteroides sp.]|nr:hypothetical protein [Parabacteroides sp.]